MAPPNYVKVFVCSTSADIKTDLHPKLIEKKIFGVSIWESPGGWHPQTVSRYLSVKYLLVSKKNWHPKFRPFKKLIFGGSFEGVPGGGGAFPNYVKIFFLFNIC